MPARGGQRGASTRIPSSRSWRCVDRRRGAGHQVRAGGRLREGDHVADRLPAGEQRRPAGRARARCRRAAARRTRAPRAGSRTSRRPRPRPMPSASNTRLHLGPVDADAAAADLDAVEHHVVGARARRRRVVRRAASSDSSVGEVNGWCSASQRPSSSFHSSSGKSVTQSELPVALGERGRSARPARAAARRASARRRRPRRRRAAAGRPGERSSALPIAAISCSARNFATGERQTRLALLDVGPDEPAGALALGELDQAVELGAGQLVRAGVDAAHDAAALEHAAEDLELRARASASPRSRISSPKRRSGLSVP